MLHDLRSLVDHPNLDAACFKAHLLQSMIEHAPSAGNFCERNTVQDDWQYESPTTSFKERAFVA